MKTIPGPVLAEFVRRPVEAFQPEQIFLFGSHAWGVPNEDSDVDLFVVAADSDEKPILRTTRARRCLRGLQVPTDVIVKTRSEIDRFAVVPASLEAEVLGRGKVLHGREVGAGPGLAGQGVA